MITSTQLYYLTRARLALEQATAELNQLDLASKEVDNPLQLFSGTLSEDTQAMVNAIVRLQKHLDK